MKLLVFACSAALLIAACSAFPTYWAGLGDCNQHPAALVGSHLQPTQDRWVMGLHSSRVPIPRRDPPAGWRSRLLRGCQGASFRPSCVDDRSWRRTCTPKRGTRRLPHGCMAKLSVLGTPYHRAPIARRTVSFTLSALGSVRAKYCPGQQHTLQVGLGGKLLCGGR